MPAKMLPCLSDSWTDDLRICPLAGIGIVTNVIYRHNGQPIQEHQMENTCIRFKGDDNTWLYGVFDGHDGNTVAEYASQKVAAELLLGQLNEGLTDDNVKGLLREAFASVERDFFVHIGDHLAKRTQLMLQLPENIYEAQNQYPETVMALNEIQQQISSGASAAMALLYRDKLYVANVGDCRILDCRIDSAGSIAVEELTVRHDVDNHDEILRLTHLGLLENDMAHLNHTTRCLGDFPRKGGYKDIDFLKKALSEPVIADAAVTGGITLDNSYRFLILATASVFKALEDAAGSVDPNRDLVGLVLKEFSAQPTINGVAQAVVDQISRRHYDAFVGGASNSERTFTCNKREDMTLLIRNFNQPLASVADSNTSSCASLVAVPGKFASIDQTLSTRSTAHDTWTPGTTSSSVWSTDSSLPDVQSLPLDENGCIPAYVDFSEFYDAIRKI